MKKQTSFLVSILLGISLLVSACGNNTDNTATGSGKGSVDSDKKTVELTMAYLNLGNAADVQLVEDEINKITSVKINTTVHLMPIDIAAWQQQTNLLLAGNEKLDLIVSSSFFGYSSQVAKGQLIALDELLEKNGPDIQKVMEPELYNSTRINGKNYGVPSLKDSAQDFGMVMRKDLIDKYNIDLTAVKTWDDLEEKVLKVIKENEPEIVPLAASQSSTPAYSIYMPLVDHLGDRLGVISFDDQELKVQNLYEMDLYRDTINRVRDWYKAGYILKDAATTQETPPNMVKANKALGYLSNMKPEFEKQESKLTGYEMVGVRLSDVVMHSNAGNGWMMSIARNSEQPERSMEFMNLLYTDAEIMNLLTLGIEGTHYVKNEDGTVRVPDGVTETGYLFNQWEIGNNFMTHVWEGTAPDIWEQTKAFNQAAKISPALGFTFDQSPIKTEVAAVTNVENQYRVGFETGTLDPAMLEQFIKALKAAGIDKIIAEKQKQLDEWAAANGK
ncbi:hypothetical protein BBD42_29630 [Paenibacillus sp. BIHB 4019]|uniref:DUF3502 domain-containing protein n=1 Tax=Paenibacillus sp. BIHB 4019 TaxID=1870819 RepID=A0A1B2DR46_9BACL|nr:ABC transporter substrate-binding protein [Paenibacillus sp. BIHB 4019]ANY70203.1 hypothetical protein BBD42_29630 [Paenibacillus sp. BIHB 4019]